MRIGSLFSGYGGLDMGVQAVYGGTVAWHAEIDKAPARILAHHHPDVPNLGDVTAVDWSRVEPVDVLTGGFPCQDVSTAGKRAGIRPGTRSGLWTHMAYIIDQLRPSLVVIENVRGLLSADAHSDLERDCWCVGDSRDKPLRALGAVLGTLADLRYDARWATVPASAVGAPHRRERVFVVAQPADAEIQGLEGCGDGAAVAERREAAGRVAARDWGPDRPGHGIALLHLLPTATTSMASQGAAMYSRNAERTTAVTVVPSSLALAIDASHTSVGIRSDRGMVSGIGEHVEGDGLGAVEVKQPLQGAHPAPVASVADGPLHGRGGSVGGVAGIGGGAFLRGGVGSGGGGALAVGHVDTVTHGVDTMQVVPLLPTATASMATGAGSAGRDGGDNLQTAVALLPTPVVNDMGDGKTPELWDEWRAGMRAKHGNGNGHGPSLAIEAQRDSWGDYAPAVARWEHVTGRAAPAPVDDKRRLSAPFVEWMMGLPAGHVTHPAIGLSRAQQLKALGNGVVPQQAAHALRILAAAA